MCNYTSRPCSLNPDQLIHLVRALEVLKSTFDFVFIAMCGVAIWYLTGARSRWETALLIITFIFVSLSPTDIFPRPWREQIVQPYVLKAVPCIAVWILLTLRLMGGKKFMGL